LITVLLTESTEATARALAASGLVHRFVAVVPPGGRSATREVAGLRWDEIETPEPGAGAVLGELFDTVDSPYVLHVVGQFDPHPTAIRRMYNAAVEQGASMIFGDYVDQHKDGPVAHPLADYQRGSLEDAFPFGPVRLWSVEAVRAAFERSGSIRHRVHHGWYDLRLKAAEVGPIVRLPEPLGTLIPTDQRASGQKVFDYLTAARDRQIEAEHVVTEHLDRLGAKLDGPFAPYEPTGEYPVLASVVIPVKNRIKTVMEAVNSALSQKTTFDFHVIVVDNHSTDGTTEALRHRAKEDPRLIHVIPDRQDLGIGGCWNVAVQHHQAGKYVVQLDSDDLYSGPDTLQRMVDALVESKAGLAVGSYTLVNMKLEPIPPGLIDHREWTDENGPNNALRIGGLGAPRAYATELLRRYPLPNASYGEDYSAVLRISRSWRVARIYDSLYWCRRWEDNSDADLNHLTKARYQTYKDRVRTLELNARARGRR
jgi:hypothetical protein